MSSALGHRVIEVDWTFLEQINLFQVAVFVVALWVIFRLLLRFWPFLHKVMDFTSTLGKLAEFMVRTDKTLADQDVKIADMHHELSYNKETSVKDAIRRVELGVKGLYDRADASDKSDQELRDEIERTRPPFSPPNQGDKS